MSDVIATLGDLAPIHSAVASTNAAVASTNAAVASINISLAEATEEADAIQSEVTDLSALIDSISDNTIVLNAATGVDVTGATDSSAIVSQLLASTSLSGCKLVVPRTAKIKLADDIHLNVKQSIVGSFNPNDASGIPGYDYTQLSSQIILASGAEILLSNGSQAEGLLIYRDGLVFNADQGDFSTWTGNGIVLAYGNDQVVRDCMVLGFEYPVRTLLDRGPNGASRLIVDRVYVDGKNGFRFNGSYDTSFFDRLRFFPYVTQGYLGAPAEGETYDPRKDRRPGVGFELVDRADGTKIGSVQVFGARTGFKANTASWMAGSISVDYPWSPTYTGAGTGSIGVHLITDVVPVIGNTVDYDPCQIGTLQLWGQETPIKIEGTAGRVAQIGAGAIIRAASDAIQIDGGGLHAPNMRFALVSGAPVKFLSQPNTKSTIRGHAVAFGPSLNSFGVPVVSAPAGSDITLVDVKIASDQWPGSHYFDNCPALTEVASADPLILPTYRGGEIETFVITGTTNISLMYGQRPGAVRLRFAEGLSIFATSALGSFVLPGGEESMVIAAGTVWTLEYSGDDDKWVVVATNT